MTEPVNLSSTLGEALSAYSAAQQVMIETAQQISEAEAADFPVAEPTGAQIS